MQKNNDLLWLVMVAGLVLGVILTVAGLALLDLNGPVLLVVGILVLVAGGAAFFARQSRAS